MWGHLVSRFSLISTNLDNFQNDTTLLVHSSVIPTYYHYVVKDTLGILKMPLSDFLAENSLDVNFVKLISPVHYLQLILGSSCIDISNNIVKTVTFTQKIYTVFWIIAVSGSLYHFVLSYYNAYFDKDKTLFYTFAFGLLVQYVSYLYNVICARFFKGEQTVKVFVLMQKVDCALKRNNLISTSVINYYITIIWISYVMISFGCGFATYVFYNIKNAFYTLPLGFGIVSVYLELISTGTCIYYLAVRLRFLNEVIGSNLLYQKLNRGAQHKRGVNKIQRISIVTPDDSETISLKDFTNILTSILKLFNDVSRLFSSQLFNVIVTLFIWTFLVIESTVVGLKTKLIPILASVTLMLWMVFYFIQLTTVAFACDWFSKQVQSTKRLILHALAVYYEEMRHELSFKLYSDDKVRKAAWEMLQLIEFEKPIFSIYGIVVLDKSLPFKLIGVITSNVLVFIQYTSNVLNTN